MKTRKDKKLSELKNIGKTVETRLNEIGVFTKKDLELITPSEAYKKMKENYPDKTLPVCYYLYSLEGAIRDVHWDDVPDKTKQNLKKQIEK
jgi:DNA transformation protein